MRLHADNGHPDCDYIVYHAERMEMLPYVVWVDDETAQYGEWLGPNYLPSSIETRQAKRIEILPAMLLVIINTIADTEDAPAVTDAIAA